MSACATKGGAGREDADLQAAVSICACEAHFALARE
jgi:hypothetical protein